MDVTGKLHVKFDTVAVSDKFTKRDFVVMIADNPQYPQYVSFQFTQDKCALLDLVESGMDVTVSFNLRGRAWTSPQGETKYFNTLEAWRILPVTAAAPVNHAPTVPPVTHTGNTPVVNIENLDDSGNDLPF